MILVLFRQLYFVVRRAADACAKMAHTSPPDDNSLEWKLYRAACKECWQQIIKQARKGKRFSMDRLAVQAHTGWSAVVKHVSVAYVQVLSNLNLSSRSV